MMTSDRGTESVAETFIHSYISMSSCLNQPQLHSERPMKTLNQTCPLALNKVSAGADKTHQEKNVYPLGAYENCCVCYEYLIVESRVE